MACFIGLMSGTSLDGVDAVLARLEPGLRPEALAHVHLPMPGALRGELMALNTPGADEIHRSALATQSLMALYAQAVTELLACSRRAPADITALGAHGQTVRHRPGDSGAIGYTVQLADGALLAELTGIDVVCDFRRRDVAAGGQGAPLVPAFHAACFARPGQDAAVLNLGGIANLTLLAADGSVRGFDCGPGNLLLDLWCQRHLGVPYDAAGRWAAGGRVLPALLARLLQEPFFELAAPKSTGRDLFSPDWLAARVTKADEVQPQDVMATLAELSATGVAQALMRHAPATTDLLVCGGGAHNADLLRRIAAQLPASLRLRSTAEAGIAPDQVEALAFAWLASQFLHRANGNLPEVTGARGPRVLGALYPAA